VNREDAKPVIKTVQQHIMDTQRKHHPAATGEFSWLLSAITLATKIIADHVRRAGLVDILGCTGQKNVQGEMVHKLDIIANETIAGCLGYRPDVGIMVSEEDDEPRILKDPGSHGKYIVLFDPLDGSSNIDVNVSIGTIFSVLQKSEEQDADVMQHILQPGYKQIAAGYVLYSSSTVMAYTTGDGVHMFALDPSIGAFRLTREDIKMPPTGKTYSINEAYLDRFPEGIQDYLRWAKSDEAGGYGLRYIGSLVADFHRTLIKGGVFLYPPTNAAPHGKLRLLYEANPLAFIAEQAGGLATDGTGRILEKTPQALHERTPLIIGSRHEVERVLQFWSA